MRYSARLFTRRSILQAIGLAFAGRLRPQLGLLANPFSSIEGSDLAWLARCFCSCAGPRFAGAG